MVEARGVEPLSEDRQRTASTCVADNLISQPSTPIGRLRTAASPEKSRPQPLSTGLGPAHCIAPFHPRGPQMEERHSLIKLRVPVLDWQLHFPGVLRVPESSTCNGDLSIPVETGRPLSNQDDENGLQPRSRSCAACDVPESVRLGCLVARALLEPILIIL